MTNSITKIKQDLRAYAKRCKDVHYTEGLVITFLITGMLFAARNLFSDSAGTSIENQKQAISTSIKTIHQQVKATRKENDKLLKSTNSINGTRRSHCKSALEQLAIWYKLL